MPRDSETQGIASKQVVLRFGRRKASRRNRWYRDSEDARHRVETGDIAILRREVSRRDDVQYSFIGQFVILYRFYKKNRIVVSKSISEYANISSLDVLKIVEESHD